MENNTLYLLIAVVIAVMGGFVFGMFYIKKKLQEGKSIGKVIALPLIVAFVFALLLLVIAFGLT